MAGPNPLGEMDRWCFVETALREHTQSQNYADSHQAALNSLFPVKQPKLQSKQTLIIIFCEAIFLLSFCLS